jgi:hypothetical protein
MSRAGISAELLAAGPLRQLVIAFTDNVDFRSEILTYHKEIEVERERTMASSSSRISSTGACGVLLKSPATS